MHMICCCFGGKEQCGTTQKFQVLSCFAKFHVAETTLTQRLYPMEKVALVNAAVIALSSIKTMIFGEKAPVTWDIPCSIVIKNNVFFLPNLPIIRDKLINNYIWTLFISVLHRTCDHIWTRETHRELLKTG